MSRNGFILLLVVTVVAIALGDAIAKRYTDPGAVRILLVAGITAVIVFPLARLAERFGWIKGSFDFSKIGAASTNDALQDRNTRGGEEQ